MLKQGDKHEKESKCGHFIRISVYLFILGSILGSIMLAGCCKTTAAQNGESAETQPETEVSEELSIYGTWEIEKVALISEMYTGTTLDGVDEEDLYDSEDFLGYELEYIETFFRIGDKVYENPKYITSVGIQSGNSF